MIVFLIILIGGFVVLWLWLKSEFKVLFLDAMEKNSNQFMNLAETTLQPLKESMKILNERQTEIEKARVGVHETLLKQIDSLVLSEKQLRKEAQQLTQALKSPQVCGFWGQLHLKRVVELAGLLNHCDFFEQKTLVGNKRLIRPDLIIHLPGDRQIAVDAKTPIQAYLEAAELEDESLRKVKLQEHAMNLRRHIKELAQKEYWKQFCPAPEYVILFLPAEAFFSAALQTDPLLIEIGASQNVIVATPTTLIAILRAVAHGWKQESLSKSAREISCLGQELYDRIGIVSEHLNRMGSSLNSAVESFNKGIASWQSRVAVSARKLKESGAFTKKTKEVQEIEKTAGEIKNL